MLILRPAYVAGKVGEVCGQKGCSSDRTQERWLIRVYVENGAENIVVSLFPKEFEVIKDDFE